MRLPRFARSLALLSLLPLGGVTLAAEGPRLSGYARTVSGEVMGYHSFHPYAGSALLTRCLDGKRTITWETDPIPAGFSGDTVAFTWIAGHSTGTSGADATFHLDVNGERWGSFTTVKERRLWKWTARGRKEGTLSFDGKWEDTVNDLFGYMTLSLPVARLRKGEPLLLSITGDSTGRRDWYMTFTYALRESVAVEPRQALLRSARGEKQLIEVGIDHIRDGGRVEITTTTGEVVTGDLPIGYTVLRCATPAVNRETTVGLTIAIDGEATIQRSVLLRPVTYREFWILPHSHNDIGYSDLQADVERKQLKNLKDAVTHIRATAGYPPEARFKWNTEILWAVDSYLNSATPVERKEFIAAVKGGGIGLNGLYANQLTGICNPEELVRLTDFARTLRQKYGVKVNDAMITDIPGATWATVPALAQGGIRYFSSGPNFLPTTPDGGDRVGYFNRAWGDRPFYWVSPSGQEKLLLWVAGKGYSWFHGWILGSMGSNTGPHLFKYLSELEERHYPYDMVQLRYTIMGDNGPTDPGLCDFVRQWNERYASPRLIISTASAMFEEFERRWGGEIPSYAGEITPYWEDGALSTLRELGSVRSSTERLLQAEALATLPGGGRLTDAALASAWRNVHLFDEHTWGAWNSVSDPENPFAVSQLDVKVRYAKDLDEGSRSLLRRSLNEAPAGETFEIVNTTTWARTDLVTLPADGSTRGDRVVDSDGKDVLSQRLASGELAFLARSVPPLRGRRYAVTPGKAPEAGRIVAGPDRLSNGLVSIELDPGTGALRSLKGPGGRELVDAKTHPGLGQYLYVPGKDPSRALRNGKARIVVLERGPLVGILQVTSEAPGCSLLVQEYMLVDGVPRVRIRTVMEKQRVREKEGVHLAFPVGLAEGRVRLDAGWGILRPGADQLPGSCKDYFSAGRWFDVSDQDQGLTCTLRGSPLVEVGEMTDESPGPAGTRLWRTSVPGGTTVYSYAMNNYWHTNYAADQSGRVELRNALHPHGAFNPIDSYRWGIEENQPLLVRRVAAGSPEAPPLFTLSSPGVVATSLRRTNYGMSIRLFAAGGRPEEFSITWGAFQPSRIYLSSPSGERGAPVHGRITLPAFGIVTLRCER